MTSDGGSAPLPILIVGAGAAGLMAAVAAAEAGGGAPILVLERTSDGGRKILISGGGRCNVLPSTLDPRDFVSDSSPNSLRKILLSWPLVEQQAFFEDQLGIPLAVEAETGKLFPVSNRARDVRDGLVRRARELGVEFRFNAAVVGATPLAATGDARWEVTLAGGERLRARALILASGGLSIPATGSDGRGLRILEGLGHTVHDLYPALTPLLADPHRHGGLAGVALEVTLTAPGAKGRTASRGGFLFTHRGYSGPTVLDLSHLATRPAPDAPRQPLLVRWTQEDPEVWDARLRSGRGTRVRALLRETLPDRLADQLLAEAGVDPEIGLARLDREARKALAGLLGAYPLPWTGSEGYRKAEVTGGGVALEEVDPRTLESRLHPRLFLCGELLDAFGPIGGYNFSWAWATGRVAGRGAAR